MQDIFYLQLDHDILVAYILYANEIHPSKQKIEPGKQCSLIIGINTFRERFNGTWTAAASKLPRSVIAKTHFSSSSHASSPNLRPRLNLG